MAVNKGGRPTVMTESTLQLLRDAFSWGCTDNEACCYADISTSTLYNYCEANPEFLEQKNLLKDMPLLKARRVISKALDEDDTSTAHKVIDRKEGQKINHISTDGSMSPNRIELVALSADEDSTD